MTRAEAIRILDPETTAAALAEIEYYAGFSGPTAKVQAVSAACEIAVEALRESPGWINVKDKLPEVKQRVLCFSPDNKMVYIARNWIDWPGGDISFAVPEMDLWIKCTHWMPLPEPPEEALEKEDGRK